MGGHARTPTTAEGVINYLAWKLGEPDNMIPRIRRALCDVFQSRRRGSKTDFDTFCVNFLENDCKKFRKASNYPEALEDLTNHPINDICREGEEMELEAATNDAERNQIKQKWKRTLEEYKGC